MSIDAFARQLGDLEIFRGLAPGQLACIARAAERMLYRDGHRIIHSGIDGRAAYVIIAGHAEVVAGPNVEAPAERVAEGSLLGEMAMLIEHEYAVTVVARGPVKALRITREAMHRLMAEDPALADHLVQRIASRLTRVAVELRRIDQMLALAAEASSPPSPSPSPSPA